MGDDGDGSHISITAVFTIANALLVESFAQRYVIVDESDMNYTIMVYPPVFGIGGSVRLECVCTPEPLSEYYNRVLTAMFIELRSVIDLSPIRSELGPITFRNTYDWTIAKDPRTISVPVRDGRLIIPTAAAA
jgi:hypothetical protein